MIAKNIKGKSFGGCVRYVMNEGCELLEAEGVFAESTQTIIRSFTMQRANRSEIKQPAGHIPMSFAPEDKGRMTNDFMLQLAKEYMQEMGIGNTQYIVVRHHNTDNDHLHIVYNRIDNNLKLISVNHDYDRNVKICKKLKDKHNLTYGTGKDRVKREKLRAPDKVKYEIYDAIKAVLSTCMGYSILAVRLEDQGITVRYKYRRDTQIIEGISFEKNGIAFKGSQIDRKFSHANLVKAFEANAEQDMKEMMKWSRSEPKPEEKSIESPTKPESPTPQKSTPRPTVQPQEQPKSPPKAAIKPQEQPQEQPKPTPQVPAPTPEPPKSLKRNPRFGGVELTDEQVETVQKHDYIYLENVRSKDGQPFSAYAAVSPDLQHCFLFNERPDNFVKYGKFEMRAMDKRLIEEGYCVKATIKWWGGGLARPYLWKPDVVKDEAAEMLKDHKLEDNSEYCLSFGDPRKPEQKQEQKPKQIQIPTNKKGFKL